MIVQFFVYLQLDRYLGRMPTFSEIKSCVLTRPGEPKQTNLLLVAVLTTAREKISFCSKEEKNTFLFLLLWVKIFSNPFGC